MAPAEESAPHLEALAAHYRQLEIWAQHCPENFEDRKALLAAEIARLEGRALDAERLYEEAIRLARENRFVQNEALGNEHAARFYAARGFVTIADAYLRNARTAVAAGAPTARYGNLRNCTRISGEKRASLRKDSTIGAPVEQLDVATVVEVSQAVSGQIDLRKLINTLMIVALEHAGAERGLLIVPSGEELRIVAEAATVRDAVEVRHRQSSVTPRTSLNRFCAMSSGLATPSCWMTLGCRIPIRRTSIFAEAPPICPVPAVVKQAKLVGAFYLENNLTPYAFTPAGWRCWTAGLASRDFAGKCPPLYRGAVRESRPRGSRTA